jgi:hypothetical protein
MRPRGRIDVDRFHCKHVVLSTCRNPLQKKASMLDFKPKSSASNTTYTRRCLAWAYDHPAESMALSHFVDALGAVTSDEFKDRPYTRSSNSTAPID